MVASLFFLASDRTSWLSVMSLFSVCLTIVLRRVCSVILLGAEVRLTGL